MRYSILFAIAFLGCTQDIKVNPEDFCTETICTDPDENGVVLCCPECWTEEEECWEEQ